MKTPTAAVNFNTSSALLSESIMHLVVWVRLRLGGAEEKVLLVESIVTKETFHPI